MSNNLKRTLNLKDAISIVAGSMIGSGIFIVSADIARQTNSAWLLMTCWILAGITTLCGALCYGELSSTIPDEGGQYVFLKKIFSEKLAFVYGWTLFAVIQTGTLAAVNIAFAKFIGLLFPIISESTTILSIGDYHLSLQRLFAIMTVVTLTFINSRGVKHGILTQHLFTIAKVVSMVAIIGVGLFVGFNFDVLMSNFSVANNAIPHGYGLLTLVSVAIVGSMFASITWNNVTFIASEIKKPKRNIPLALLIGTCLVIALYFCINMIYVGVMPLDVIKTSHQDIVAAELINSIYGKNGMMIIAVIIAISAFGCSNGMIMTGSRVYYKMAKDKLFFRTLARVNRKTKVPENSLWLQCFWICALILWGSYSQLLDYVIYSSLIFYMITIAGIFKMRKIYAKKRGVYRVNNAVIITFLMIAGYIVLGLTFYKPQYTVPGLLITLVGFPIYTVRDKIRRKKIAVRQEVCEVQAQETLR